MPATTWYPVQIVDRIMFTTRDFSGYYNTGAGTTYPFAWPDIAGDLTNYWNPGNDVDPPLNIDNPSVTGGPYTFETCKDGTPANIGFLLTNVGPQTTAATAYPGPLLNGLFNDYLQYGIYGVNSNMQVDVSCFTHMQAIGGGSSAIGGDGIYDICNLAPTGGLPYQYQLKMYEISSPPDVFYECRDGVEANSITTVNIQGIKMWSDHTTTASAAGYRNGNTGISITANLYNDIELNYNYISNYMNGIDYFSTTDQHNGTLNITYDTILGQTSYWPDGFCNTGIIANNRLASSSTRVYTGINILNNEMVNVFSGIYVNGFKHKPVTNNENNIEMITNTVTTGTRQFGIYNSNCTNNTINDNFILGGAVASNAIIRNTNGIGGQTNTNASIKCNGVFNVDTGFNFYGSPNNTHWWQNGMQNNSIGMFMNSLIGQQYQAGYAPSDNVWLGTNWAPITNWQTYGAGATLATLNKMWVRNSGSGGGTAYDTYGFGYNQGSPPPAGYLSAASLNNVGARPYVSCVAPYFKFRYDTYRTTDTTIDSIVAPFSDWQYDQPVYESIAQLTYDTAMADSTPAETIARQEWVAQKNLYDAMHDDSSLVDSSAILHEFDSVALNSRYAWLSNIAIDLNTGNISGAQSLLGYGIDALNNSYADNNTGIKLADNSNADVVVNNYKVFYNIYIKYLNQTMTPSDSIMVKSIAELCPDENGKIVFDARALYWTLFHDLGNFNDICYEDMSDERRMNKATNMDNSIQNYTLYPNPNNGMLTLMQYTVDNHPVNYMITNIVGQKIEAETVVFTNGKYQIQLLANTPTGVYILQIKDIEGKIYNLKFIIE